STTRATGHPTPAEMTWPHPSSFLPRDRRQAKPARVKRLTGTTAGPHGPPPDDPADTAWIGQRNTGLEPRRGLLAPRPALINPRRALRNPWRARDHARRALRNPC